MNIIGVILRFLWLGIWTCISWIFAHLIKYRYNIIYTNLSLSFPSKDVQFIQDTIHQYYYNLLSYIRQSIELMFFSYERLSAYIDISLLKGIELPKNKNIIIMASHLGNWELVIPLLPKLLNRHVVGFYKPLSNKFLDKILKNIRGRFGLELQPIDQTLRIMHKYNEKCALFIFISDQSPVNLNNAYCNIFLNQKTIWLNGAAKLAIKRHLPVYNLEFIPDTPKNDHYRLYMYPLSQEESYKDEKEIMYAYTSALEKLIVSHPTYWLWSHRRWKRTRNSS